MTRASKLKLAKKVKTTRLDKGWTLEDICSKVKISKPAYMRMEKGIRFPRFDKMVDTLKLLDISPVRL